MFFLKKMKEAKRKEQERIEELERRYEDDATDPVFDYTTLHSTVVLKNGEELHTVEELSGLKCSLKNIYREEFINLYDKRTTRISPVYGHVWSTYQIIRSEDIFTIKKYEEKEQSNESIL